MRKYRIKTIQIKGIEYFIPQTRRAFGFWCNLMPRDQVQHFRYLFQAQEVITRVVKHVAYRSRYIEMVL